MTNQEVLELLRKIDQGYKPTKAEKEELASIDQITWKQIEKIPKCIDILTGLTMLDISGNLSEISNLMDIPESIGNLTSLWLLDLSDIQISMLPESIGKLTSLQVLDLSDTQISTLPENIGNLTRLKTLFLSNTQISTLPDNIGNLTLLKTIDLRNTQISTLPESIVNLTRLQSLDLSNTQIRTLPESIGNLTSLERLDLSGMQISDFPKNIATLPELKELALENLTLSELPEDLLSLNLDFKNERYASWRKKPGIYIQGLRLLKQPVSLFLQPRELIEDYYRQPHITVNETKVIFFGSGGVGKTHTIKRILNDNHKIDEDLKETPGISITSKEFSTDDTSYRINFWDFGGQEIMHAMHRCFLTDRTGYVVVVSTRFGDANKQARYWLRSIESFTEGAPIVIFVNEWSEGTYYQIDEVSLRRDYPNITAVRQCSARDGEDAAFAQVVRTIQDMALANDSISMSFPEPWEKVRQKIIALGRPGSHKYYISQEEFREECRKNGIENEDIQTWLLDWFNDLGECFSYEFDEELQDSKQDLKVLDPAWLTNAIYIIIREAGDLALNGTIPHEGIQKKLDYSDKGTLKGVSYNADECDYVLEVMRKFRLSYKVPGKRLEFIPALLRDKMPTDLEPADANSVISYEMRYKYLPENVIHNLMIAMYPYLDHKRCWRKGMVIDVRNILSIGLYAVLDMSHDDGILSIKVYSYANRAPWELLQEIRSTLLDINNSMDLDFDEYIPISDTERVSVDRLLILLKRSKRRYTGSDEEYEDTGDIYNTNSLSIEEKLESFFQKYPDKCPHFIDLQQFIEEEKSRELQEYLHNEMDDLFRFVETQDTDSRKAQELLELIWMLYLMDSNRVKKVEILASSSERPLGSIHKGSNGETMSSPQDSVLNETQEPPAESKDEPEQYKPKPSDLEDATLLVLEDFKKWWEEKADRMGLTFSIDKDTTKQKSGWQFGYDVGLNTEFGGLKYRLRFECKDYTSNISDSKHSKNTDLNVRNYAYNLLEYFMFCESRVNMRWILICPFGGLQNDFPERLFEHWNDEHDFIKIYAIMEKGSSITCKDFLSVNKDAYRKIYKKDYDGDKTKDKVFKDLYDKIIGTDDVREAALKRLKQYVFWDEYGGHKGLLPVPDRTNQIALKQIISFLQRKKGNTDDERKKTLFVIGEYGTGKSWLCYRAIEQIVLHPNDFPFMPFYLRLKDLSQKKDLEDKTQYKDIMTDTLKEFSKKYDEWAAECVRKALQPVFFLDGFDEVFSGLSVTDKKIHFLLRIISELKDWYEKYENEREIKKHTKPLFVITSRESDFEIGMKSKDFQYQMDQAEIIELEMCSVEEVQKEWNKLEEEDHTDRSWIFKLEQNSAFLNIIRRPVFYRLCSDALKDDTFKQKVDLASVDEVDVLNMLFEYELQNYARGERLDKNEIKSEIYQCAVKCSKEKISKVDYSGKGINQIIHVGMVKIRKDQEKEGTCWVSFEHNIVREYLTAKFLGECLICCSSEEIEDPMRTTFVQTLQELSLTPEALKFLLLCIEKESPVDKGRRYKELLKKWLCNRNVKSLDSRLPARMLEILLQPGYTLSGEQEERLDLTGLHASDLCLWNCGMRHVNLGHAILKNWQMINMELDDVDLRNANMEGLRLAPDKPISSFCQWKDTKEWHVAALHKDGQLMKYNFPNDSWKQHSAEVLSITGVNDGIFCFSNELMLYSVKKLYDEKENELYQIRSNIELERIVTASGLCGFITKQGDNYQVAVFQGEMAPIAYSLGKIEQSNLILTSAGQVLFVQDGVIKLISQNGETRQLCKWESSYECFTAQSILSENDCIYIKCDDRLIRIALDEKKQEVKSLRKVLQIQGDLEKLRELRVLNESALAAIGKNELYILSIEKINDVEIVKSRRLKTAIKIVNSLLEDEGGGNRVQDNNAYELLSTSMQHLEAIQI